MTALHKQESCCIELIRSSEVPLAAEIPNGGREGLGSLRKVMKIPQDGYWHACALQVGRRGHDFGRGPCRIRSGYEQTAWRGIRWRATRPRRIRSSTKRSSCVLGHFLGDEFFEGRQRDSCKPLVHAATRAFHTMLGQPRS